MSDIKTTMHTVNFTLDTTYIEKLLQEHEAYWLRSLYKSQGTMTGRIYSMKYRTHDADDNVRLDID